MQVFFIYLKFHSNFPENDDPIILLRRLRKLGKFTVIPHTNTVPPLEEYEPDRLYIQWTVKLSTKKSQADIEALLASVIADTKNSIKIEEVTLPPPDPGILNQATEEKLLSTAPASQKIDNSLQTPNNTWFKVGRNIFMFDSQCIVESLRAEKMDSTQHSKKTITIQGDVITVLPLHRLLHLPYSKDLNDMSILIIEYNEKKYGFLVDNVISPLLGKNSPIKGNFSQQPYISGAMLLENDEIAFKLDISQLVSKEF